jgi:hypothetical protein
MSELKRLAAKPVVAKARKKKLIMAPRLDAGDSDSNKENVCGISDAKK